MNNETLFYAALAINQTYPFIQKDQGGRVWEPHLNDGDAFRLYVKCKMHVNVYHTDTRITADDVFLCEMHGIDPYTATRHAIVRAAAEIGRNRSDWVVNTCKEDGCPIKPNSMIAVVYDDDFLDFGKACSWQDTWNSLSPVHIKKYLIIDHGQ
jgi:hypothetical protein